MLTRDTAQQQPVFPLTVVEDGRSSMEDVARAEAELGKMVAMLSAAAVPAQPVTRIAFNVTSGILRARRELRGSDVIIGWRGRSTPHELFFGSLMEQMLRDRDFNLTIARLPEPLNTNHRIVVAVPPNAEREEGFVLAAGTIKRLAQQLGAPVVLVGAQAGEARCALVPPPGFHMTRYFGVLASRHQLRPLYEDTRALSSCFSRR